MYNIISETSHQSRFNVGYWMLGVGALGRPGGMVWGGRREEGSGWGTHVYLWWIHFDVWQNQYNIVKLKNKIKKNLYYAHGLEKLILFKWSYYQDNQQIQCNLYQNTNGIFHRTRICSIQLLSSVQLFATPWTAALQASLSITNSQILLKLMSIQLVMPSNHLIFCHPLLLLPSIFSSIRVFSNESVLLHHMAKVLELQLQYQSFQ